MNIMNSSMMDLMAKSLDAYTIRNEAIANNIANEDTPSYKRQDVNFESLLNDAIDVINAKNDASVGNRGNKYLIGNQNYNNNILENGITSVKPEIYTQETGSMYRIDGNNVDIDNEMSQLVKNQMRYSVVMSQLNRNFTALRTAMNR